MSEKPIIFSADMVRAILDGRKTVTRRVIKRDLVNMFDLERDGSLAWPHITDEYGQQRPIIDYSPYGRVGDCLWGRETWATDSMFDNVKPSEIPHNSQTYYKAGRNKAYASFDLGKLRPSIFMPRWASRIQLRVTDVRVERVQEITQGQVLHEGLGIPNDGLARRFDPIMTIKAHPELMREWVTLWDSINAKRGYSWESNPFVWVVEFEVIKP